MADDYQGELEEVVADGTELNLKLIMLTVGIISVRLSQNNSCAIQTLLFTYLRSLHRIYISAYFCRIFHVYTVRIFF